ncbi:hypothetical protein GCM10010518_43100 [Kitasatospora cinereorecta]
MRRIVAVRWNVRRDPLRLEVTAAIQERPIVRAGSAQAGELRARARSVPHVQLSSFFRPHGTRIPCGRSAFSGIPELCVAAIPAQPDEVPAHPVAAVTFTTTPH